MVRVWQHQDIPALAKLRALEWGDVPYWEARVACYLEGRLNPGQALEPRTGFVAAHADEIAGFVAGHLTRRWGCDGEIQWLNVAPEWRRQGVASSLLAELARWFAEEHNARRICVNVEPDNAGALAIYSWLGAEPLNQHWLVWRDFRTVARVPAE